MHVAEILDRKRGVAIVLGRAGRQHASAEPASFVDQRRLVVGEAKGCRIEDRRVCGLPVEVTGGHGRNWTSRRKVEDRRIEGGRRLEVRQMSDAGETHVLGAGDLAGHALHHLRRGVGVLLAGEAKHGNADVGKIGALVEADQATHHGSVGVGRHGAHYIDGQRARCGFGRGAIMASTIRGASSAMLSPASSGASLSATNFVWNSPPGLPKAGLVQASTAAA